MNVVCLVDIIEICSLVLVLRAAEGSLSFQKVLIDTLHFSEPSYSMSQPFPGLAIVHKMADSLSDADKVSMGKLYNAALADFKDSQQKTGKAWLECSFPSKPRCT